MSRDNLSDFRSELAGLLNKYSADNAAQTPDFILARYLLDCMEAFRLATAQRDDWRSRDKQPSVEFVRGRPDGTTARIPSSTVPR